MKFVLLAILAFISSNCYAGYADELAQKCNQGDGKTCALLAEKYEEGAWLRGIWKSKEKAATYYEKACRLNVASACIHLAYMHFVAGSYAGARWGFERACRLNDGGGCTELGGMYEEGEGVRKSYSTARRYYEKACRLEDSEGCKSLALMYELGVGVRKSERRAQYYYVKACEFGDEESCKEADIFY